MAIGAAAIIAVGAITKTIISANQASKARQAIERYDRQELTNAFAETSVSTLGADLQREELARASAMGIDALQASGTRGLVGGLGRLQQIQALQSREIGADLDRQQKEIDRLRAQDRVRMRELQEQRERADLAGLGQQYNVGRQGVMAGISDFQQAGGMLAGLKAGGSKDNDDEDS